MSDSPAVSLEGVRKRYRDGAKRVDALHPIDLTIERGTFCVLRGPSGSGKTTLLGLMGAMIAPTAGRVEVLGQDVTHLRDHHRAAFRRSAVGFVFQELSLIPAMSVWQNILLPLTPLGGADAAARARARELLDRFGMAARADERASRLSGGERQRVALARALLPAPPMLLLDEPTAHLDRELAADFAESLASLRDEGRTVIATTHDPRLAEHAAVDRTIYLEDGRLVMR